MTAKTSKWVDFVYQSNKTKIDMYVDILVGRYKPWGLSKRAARKGIEDGIFNTGELAEHFMSDLFGAKKQVANNAGYDLITESGKTIECKTFSWWLGQKPLKSGEISYRANAAIGGKKSDLRNKYGDIAFMYPYYDKSYLSLVPEDKWKPLVDASGSIKLSPTNNSFTQIHSMATELDIKSFY